MRATGSKAVSLGGTKRFGRLPPGAEDATPERLTRAAREGQVGVEQGTRRLADAFDALRNRQLLDRSDKRRNEALWEAGARFRRHWHGSRLDGLTAFDFTRESVDGAAQAGASTPTEAAIRHREACRRAAAAVGPRLMPYVTGIVIDSRTAGALCHLVTDTSHARTAETLVVERLREALDRLDEHWERRGRARAPEPLSPSPRRPCPD